MSESQGRMFTVLEMIRLLHISRYTVKALARRFDSSEKTIYRYIELLEELEIPIEKGFDKKYFIVPGPCPFCGGKN